MCFRTGIYTKIIFAVTSELLGNHKNETKSLVLVNVSMSWIEESQTVILRSSPALLNF